MILKYYNELQSQAVELCSEILIILNKGETSELHSKLLELYELTGIMLCNLSNM
jgi:hypothetical protein